MRQQSERAYNLFRLKQTPDVYCAIPEDRPLARFLKSGGWEYGGRLDGRDGAPAGFERRAADWSARSNGFYFFHAVGPVDELRAPAHRPAH
jgi:hypothetical protein